MVHLGHTLETRSDHTLEAHWGLDIQVHSLRVVRAYLGLNLQQSSFEWEAHRRPNLRARRTQVNIDHGMGTGAVSIS